MNNNTTPTRYTVIYERADETTRTEEFITTLTISQCLNPLPCEKVRAYITHTNNGKDLIDLQDSLAKNNLLEM